MNNIRLSLSIAGGMCSVLKLQQSLQTEHAGDRTTISGAFIKSTILENAFLDLEKTFSLLGYKTSFSFAQKTLPYLPFFLAYQIYCQEKSEEKNQLWLKTLILSQDLISPLYQVASFMQALALIYSGAHFAGGLAIGILAAHYLAEIYLDSAFMQRIEKTYYVFLQSLGLFSSRWKIKSLSFLALLGVARKALIDKTSSLQSLAVQHPANNLSSTKQLNQILNAYPLNKDASHFLKVNREYVHFDGLPEPPENIQLNQLIILLEEQIKKNREILLTEFNFVATYDEKFNQENICLESDEEKIQFLTNEAKRCIKLIETRGIKEGKLEEKSYLFLSNGLRLCLAELTNKQQLNLARTFVSLIFRLRYDLRLCRAELTQLNLAGTLVYLIFRLRYCGPGQVETVEELTRLNILADTSRSNLLRRKLLTLLQKDRETAIEPHPYFSRTPDLQNLHTNNQLSAALNLGIRPEAVASDVEAQEKAACTYFLLWPMCQLIRYFFWKVHTPDHIIELIYKRLGTENFTHKEVKDWWKDWANVLPENEKQEFINKIDQFKIGDRKTCKNQPEDFHHLINEDDNRITKPVIAAMLVAMGILELNSDTSANGES